MRQSYQFQGFMYVCTKICFLVTKAYIITFHFPHVPVHSLHLSSSNTLAKEEVGTTRIVLGMRKTGQDIWSNKCVMSLPFCLFSMLTLHPGLIFPYMALSFAKGFKTWLTRIVLAVTKVAEFMPVGSSPYLFCNYKSKLDSKNQQSTNTCFKFI